MILRRFALTLIVGSSLSVSGPAQEALPSRSTVSPSSKHEQDFSEVVVPITSVKFTPSAKLGVTGRLGPGLDMNAKFGTGFCLDATCRFIGTNYHVAVTTRVHKVKGEEIFQRYLATGPHDEGATVNTLANGDVLPYAMKRDLAIFELRHSLPHHHGLGFSLDELDVGQEVDIYGYPKGTEITAYINGDIPLDPKKFQSPDAAKTDGAIAPPPTAASVETMVSTIELKSAPDGAEISIDGKYVGNTPTTLHLSVGDHVIKFEKPGFKPWERTLSITSGETTTIPATLEQLEKAPSQ